VPHSVAWRASTLAFMLASMLAATVASPYAKRKPTPSHAKCNLKFFVYACPPLAPDAPGLV